VKSSATQVDIPKFLSHLKTYGGYPVPFVQMWIDGKPDFRVIDPEKVARCVNEKLCAICGVRLGEFSFFIGGDLCQANHLTIDGAAASSSYVLRHVRRHPNVPALAHEIRRVKTLVAAHRHAPASRNFLQHLQRGIALGWEGDLIGGTKNSHIATLVERHSRFTALVNVRSKDTAAVVAALSRQIRRLPTWLEMARHKTFTVATNVKVYFCDPHSPWQRGTNENTNRLLRQYLPKRTDLSGYTQSELDKIALRLNQRPRKTLGFETPASKLHASVAPTS